MHTLHCAHRRNMKPAWGVGLINIGLAIAASYGFSTYIGLIFSTLMTILPFLLIGLVRSYLPALSFRSMHAGWTAPPQSTSLGVDSLAGRAVAVRHTIGRKDGAGAAMDTNMFKIHSAQCTQDLKRLRSHTGALYDDPGRPCLWACTSGGLAVSSSLTPKFKTRSQRSVSPQGVDGMFVLQAALDNTPDDMPMPERMAATLSNAGVSVTVASLTNFAAFAIGSNTSLPALRALLALRRLCAAL